MAPLVEEAFAIEQQQSQQQHTQQSHPRLRRLASKPLKLAASTLRSGAGVLSRASSPGPSTTAALADHNAYSDTNGAESSDVAASARVERKSSRRNIRGRKSRHLHLPGAAAALTPAQIASIAKGPRKPLEGEEPAAWLRVRVVSAKGLVAKDRGGTSDPYVNSRRSNTQIAHHDPAPSDS